MLYFYLKLILDVVLPCLRFIFYQTSLEEVDVVIVEQKSSHDDFLASMTFAATSYLACLKRVNNSTSPLFFLSLRLNLFLDLMDLARSSFHQGTFFNDEKAFVSGILLLAT